MRTNCFDLILLLEAWEDEFISNFEEAKSTIDDYEYPNAPLFGLIVLASSGDLDQMEEPYNQSLGCLLFCLNLWGISIYVMESKSFNEEGEPIQTTFTDSMSAYSKGVPVPTVEDYCLGMVLEVMNNAIKDSIEVEMMFLKGHVSPPPPESQDDDEQQICQTHCELKSYLFEKISEIDTCVSESERIAEYLHACEDLLSAVDEIQGRLDRMLRAQDLLSFDID